MRRVLVAVVAGLIPALAVIACSSTPNPPPLDCDGPCPTQPPKDATVDRKDVATVDAPADAPHDAPSDADAGITDAHADGDAASTDAAADAPSDAGDDALDAALVTDSDAAP